MPSIKILQNITLPGRRLLRKGKTVELTDEEFQMLEKSASPKSWEKKRGRKPKAKPDEAED